MRVSDAIARLDNLYPNQYDTEIKINWLSILDAQIHTDIIETHELKDPHGRLIKPEPFIPYTVDDMDVELTVPFPYDEMYPSYLKCKVDEMNEETERYNNHAILYNEQYSQFAKYYNKTHKPLPARYHYVGVMREEAHYEAVPDDADGQEE